MKLIPKKKLSVMQIVKQALENESLLPKAQDTLVKEGLDKASDMFERWYPSLYNYKAYSESCQKRLRTTNVLEMVNLEFKRRTKKIGAFPSEKSSMKKVLLHSCNCIHFIYISLSANSFLPLISDIYKIMHNIFH